jgi:hypothetical protein
MGMTLEFIFSMLGSHPRGMEGWREGMREGRKEGGKEGVKEGRKER